MKELIPHLDENNCPKPPERTKKTLAFFGSKFIGQVVAEKYNKWTKNTTVDIITTAGTKVTIIKPTTGHKTKWKIEER